MRRKNTQKDNKASQGHRSSEERREHSKTISRGTWVAQTDKCPTLNLSSGIDLSVLNWNSMFRPCLKKKKVRNQSSRYPIGLSYAFKHLPYGMVSHYVPISFPHD